MHCRHCANPLTHTLIDLATSPPSNAYLTEADLNKPEKYYPLRVLVCEKCWLVQTEDFAQADELFDGNYAYFSGFSTSWLEHCKKYVHDTVERFGLTTNSHVVEVAANDGYLLQYILDRKIPCTGIEPTASTAAAARAKSIPIVEDFFGARLANSLVEQGLQADWMIANNVLAHVPDINDFVRGFAILLKPSGVATFEFPHLVRLVAENQFDTIYHEHFSYLSLTAVQGIFAANGLQVFDVQKFPTHGGSLRVFAQSSEHGTQPIDQRVSELLAHEQALGVKTLDYYGELQTKANGIKNGLLEFLIQAKQQGKTVAAYGAAAKGNTLLNYAGIRSDLVSFVVDLNPAKQGKYMPGSRIPILPEEAMRSHKPDYVLILPWNLTHEVVQQLQYVKAWGGQLFRAVPELSVQ